MRSVNARCVSIGLVLALSNCSESGGEPDAMLDMHHPGTGIDSHHPQFHNSYGNMKFIIIVIKSYPRCRHSPRDPTYRGRFSRSRSQRFFQVLDVSSRRVSFRPRPPRPPSRHRCVRRSTPIADKYGKQVSLPEPPRTCSTKRNVTHVRPCWRIILPFFLLPFRSQ